MACICMQTWLPMGSEQVVRRHTSKVHDVLWLDSALLWATDAGLAACQATGRAPCAPLPKPHTAGAHACSLASVTPDIVLVAWPHAVQVVSLSHKRTRLAAAVALTSLQAFSVPYRVHGIAPFGPNIALLADVSPAACRPMPLDLHEQSTPQVDPSEGAADDASEENKTPEEDVGGTEAMSLAQEPPQEPPLEVEEPGVAATPPAAEGDPGEAAQDPGSAGDASGMSGASPAEPGSPQAVAEATKGDDTSEAALDLYSPRSPPVLEGTPDGSGDVAGTSQQPGVRAQRPPKLRLPLEAMRSPATPLLTPAGMGEEDGGKSHLQLRVLSTLGKELTADDLDVEYEGLLPHHIASQRPCCAAVASYVARVWRCMSVGSCVCLHGAWPWWHNHQSWEPASSSCLLYTSPSPRDRQKSRMPSSA